MSYIVLEDRIWAHITCYRANDNTNVIDYASALTQALIDMRDLLLSAQDLDDGFAKRQFRIQRPE